MQQVMVVAQTLGMVVLSPRQSQDCAMSPPVMALAVWSLP